MKYTAKSLSDIVGLDSVGRKKSGNFIMRREFFYTNGYTSDKFADRISKDLKAKGVDFQVVDHGEQWKPFRGGANTANSSHWWVEIKINQA